MAGDRAQRGGRRGHGHGATPAAGRVCQAADGDSARGQAAEQLPAPLQERPQQPTTSRSWLGSPWSCPAGPILWCHRITHGLRSSRTITGNETRGNGRQKQGNWGDALQQEPWASVSLTSMMTVASSLVVSNIFFSCLKGPIRKHVLWVTDRGERAPAGPDVQA